MPNRWPIASGNWSDSAIWSGSLIPTASDDVFLNNQTVTLDQNVTVQSIRNTATGSVLVNGQLDILGDYNIIATGLGLVGGNVTITNFPIRYFNSGSITIQANFISNRNILDNLSTGTINVIGNISGPAALTYTTIRNSSVGVINITGNITAVSTNAAVANTSVGTINITGDVTGGGPSNGAHAVINSSIGTLNITGRIIGGSAAAAINSTTAGIINVIGQLQASTTANAVSSTSTTATNIFSGPFINSGSRNAIYCYNVRLYDDVTTRYTIGVSGSNNTITLFSPDQVTGVPSGSDVRVGTVYGPGNELTGSMAVPHPQSVSYGVAVDQTTGSALVKPEDIWNIAITSLTSSNSIGQRLASTATSASNAAIVSSFSS
jgi:hypothetical protein